MRFLRSRNLRGKEKQRNEARSSYGLGKIQKFTGSLEKSRIAAFLMLTLFCLTYTSCEESTGSAALPIIIEVSY